QIFTPAELYVLFQQNRLLPRQGRRKTFVNALATGRFPTDELKKFVAGQASLVDDFLADSSQTLEASETNQAEVDDFFDSASEIVESAETKGEQKLPIIETVDVLDSLVNNVVTSADEETVEYLLASAVAKIWKHAYQDEEAAVTQANAFSGDGYAEQ